MRQFYKIFLILSLGICFYGKAGLSGSFANPAAPVPSAAPAPAALVVGTPIDFFATCQFQLADRGMYTVGLSANSYDSNLAWGEGSGVLLTVEPVGDGSKKVFIYNASTKKYIKIQNQDDSTVASSKATSSLVYVTPSLPLDKTDARMQFYLEGGGSAYKIRSVFNNGYFYASTGAVIRVTKLDANSKYTVPIAQNEATPFKLASIQPRTFSLNPGDFIRFKTPDGGYLGFDDAGNFKIITSVTGYGIPQFKVDSYDSAKNILTLKYLNQFVCFAPTPGGPLGGLPYTFNRSATNTPAPLCFATNPSMGDAFYLKLSADGSQLFLRSSPSGNVISTVVTDSSQQYLFRMEPGVDGPREWLSTISTNLTPQNVRDDFDNRFSRAENAANLAASDWEYIGKLLLQYVTQASTLADWTKPGASNGPSLRDSALALLQKIPASFSQAAAVKAFMQNASLSPALQQIRAQLVALNIGLSDADLGQLMGGMQGTVTRDVVVNVVPRFFQAFMAKNQKSDEDWSSFTPFLIAFITKASKDLAEWQDPILDTVDQGVSKRISIKDYVGTLLAYIANPFSGASAAAQAAVKAYQQSNALVTPAVGVQASNSPFVQGKYVVVQSADGTQMLLFTNQKTVQFQSGLTKFNPGVQAKVVTYDAANAKVTLSFGGCFFDGSSSSFSLTDATKAQPFSIVPGADTTTCYLSLAAGKQLVIGTNFASGCSLGAQGTLFKIRALDPVYLSLPQIKLPASSAELENSLQALTDAFDLVRTVPEDLTFLFSVLQQYCQPMSVSPDWSLPIKGAIIVNDSPLNYVKNALQTILTLQVRYTGMSSSLKSSMQQYLASSIFTPIQVSQSLATGALCYFSAGTGAALALDSTGTCIVKSVYSFLDPAIHGIITRFDAATVTMNLSLNGVPLVTNAANQLVSGAAAGSFRVMSEAQNGYSILNTQNKKLRYDATKNTVSFGDTGPLVGIAFMTSDQRVLDALSGDLIKDILLYERALLQVRTIAGDLEFVVRSLIAYTQKASQNPTWYTLTGIDTKNPATTVRDYSATILTRVRDASTIFIAVPQLLKDVITAALTTLQDNTVMYAQQMATLDASMKNITSPSMLTITTDMASVLNALVGNIAGKGTSDQRNTLLQNLQTYLDATVVKGLAGAPDAAQLAWYTQIVQMMDRLVLFDASSAGTWEDKFSAAKASILAVIQGGSDAQKLAGLQIVSGSSLKKLAVEGMPLADKLSSWNAFKQFLTNMSFDLSQINASTLSAAQAGSLTTVQQQMDDILVTVGLKQSAPQPVPLPTPQPTVSVVTPAPDNATSLSQDSNTSAPVVVQQQVPPTLLAGLMGAAVEAGERVPVVVHDSTTAPASIQKVVSRYAAEFDTSSASPSPSTTQQTNKTGSSGVVSSKYAI